jgi:hypothetical protein
MRGVRVYRTLGDFYGETGFEIQELQEDEEENPRRESGYAPSKEEELPGKVRGLREAPARDSDKAYLRYQEDPKDKEEAREEVWWEPLPLLHKAEDKGQFNKSDN